jgi:hypothetical protein
MKFVCQATETRREREFREMIRREYQQKVVALALEAISPADTPRNLSGDRTPQPTPPATPRGAEKSNCSQAIPTITSAKSSNASSSNIRPLQELSSPKSARSRRSASTSPNRPRRDGSPQKTFLDEMHDARQRQADAQRTAMALRQFMPEQVRALLYPLFVLSSSMNDELNESLIRVLRVDNYRGIAPTLTRFDRQFEF